jgi:hypothetical protein
MRSVSKIIASTAAIGLVLGSTSAAVAAPAKAVPLAQPEAPNAWLMLSALGPTRTVALGGAAAAAQPADGPPPPPAPYVGGPVISGELVALILWFGLIAVALGTDDSSGRPNTPA